MNYHQQNARDDFDRSYHCALWADRLARLRHRPTHLRAFHYDRRRYTVRGERILGLCSVPVDRIVGSTERCGDFDTAFRPLRASSYHRWVSVARAHGEGRGLPPVQLYQLEGAYYVRDGHHRVSVARVRGQVAIEAEVIQVLTHTPLPAPRPPTTVSRTSPWWARFQVGRLGMGNG